MKPFSEDYIHVWGRLRNMIDSKGLKYHDIAGGVGISYPYLMNLFNIHKHCKLQDFLLICAYCEIDPASLLQIQKRKESDDLAIVQHIDLIRLFDDRDAALKLTQKLLELEGYGQLDYIDRMVDIMLDNERKKHPKTDVAERG